MNNFEYKNTVKIIFGKGTIPKVANEIPQNSKVLMVYGGGSIKRNGVYDQVKNALKNFVVFEFGGIEANPHYETCMKAIDVVKEKNIGFLLAVGGGSVVDATHLLELGIIKKAGDGIKLLGKGEITYPLTVKVSGVSRSAREKIEASGGSVEVI